MATVTQSQYQLKPGETITSYNSRIAGLRGDSATELASMQKTSQDYATKNPTQTAYASRLGAPTTTAPSIAPTQTNALPQSGGYTPYNSGTSAADSYYKTLLSSMKPSAEENNIYGQQTALDAQMRNLSNGQGVMNRNIADQPIELGFITGQQRSLEDRYALQRGDVQNKQQTLQSQLANLQRNRQSAIDVAKLGVDYGQYQDSRASNNYQSNFNNQLNLNKYNSDLTQQQYANQYNSSQDAITNSLNQQKLAPKTTSGGTSTISTPTGGIDSSGGANYISMKTADLKQSAQKMFAPALATQIISSLTDEQLRLFMNDFTQTQNTAQQSIDPEAYLAQWKQAAGIGTKSGGETITNPFK